MGHLGQLETDLYQSGKQSFSHHRREDSVYARVFHHFESNIIGSFCQCHKKTQGVIWGLLGLPGETFPKYGNSIALQLRAGSQPLNCAWPKQRVDRWRNICFHCHCATFRSTKSSVSAGLISQSRIRLQLAIARRDPNLSNDQSPTHPPLPSSPYDQFTWSQVCIIISLCS